MAGLFGLFGKKDQDDYYLDQDDAQSFGDAEFMRRPQEVKKTFPKMSGGKAFVPPKISPKTSFESVKPSASTNGSFATPSFNNSTPSTPSFNNNTETPSSNNNMETPSPNNNSNDTNTETPSFNNTQTPIQPPSERRKSDSSMDMFRDMAKNIRR